MQFSNESCDSVRSRDPDEYGVERVSNKKETIVVDDAGLMTRKSNRSQKRKVAYDEALAESDLTCKDLALDSNAADEGLRSLRFKKKQRTNTNLESAECHGI